MMVLDLLRDMEISPRKKAGTHGGEYASPCPACGGGDRFLVWPEQGESGTWYCRGCDKGGDAIAFLREFRGMSFAEACEVLGVKREVQRRPLTVPKPKGERTGEAFTPKEHKSPEALWQKKAGELLAYAHAKLLANPAELARLERRGLPLGAVKHFTLGWLPGEKGRDCYHRARSAWGLPEEKDTQGKIKKLWIPRGLIIPALDAAGVPIRLRIRRPEADRERFLPDMKFAMVSGSFMGPLLLNPNSAKACVVIEAELDAMATAWAAVAANLPVAALAVGTNLGKPDAAAHALLERCLSILVALDFDAPDEKGKRPGAQGYTWWRGQYRAAERWPVPQGKDPGEAAQNVDLAAWVRAGLPPVLTRKQPKGDSKLQETSESSPESMPSPATTTSAPVAGNFSMPVGRSGFGLPLQGEGDFSRPPPGANGTGPADWLTHPIGPMDSLRVLARAGLTAVPAGDDYRISGHEQWPGKDAAQLTGWLRRHGEWVRQALYPQSAEVRVSPKSSSSTGRPDVDASDQECSQPSCCAPLGGS